MDLASARILLGTAGGDDTFEATDVFSPTTYSGNSSTQAVTNGIDLSGKGGLVWLKERSGGGFDNHHQIDTERGRLNSLSSNLAGGTAASSDPYPYLSSFNSNGFTLGYNFATNASGSTYISWTFREAPGFFDIVTYSGNGTNQTIAHSLESVPKMIWVKRLDSSSDWAVYHENLGNDKRLDLNTTDDPQSFNGWNNTTPTSTVFSVGADSDTNNSSGTYVAYLFGNVDGISKVGSYTGTGASVTNTIDCGFSSAARFVMIKLAHPTDLNDWYIVDSARGYSGSSDPYLKANTSDTESTLTNLVTQHSSGFQLQNGYSATNSYNKNYIYLAIA